MTKFNEVGLVSKILPAIEKINYENLTPIQEVVIPAILNGKDILACSQTGSGKTGAFLIPLLSKMIENKNKKVLIITPTRELAEQILAVANSLSIKDSGIKKALLIGGKSLALQLKSILENPQLIIGTPGRINDFLDSSNLSLEGFDSIVLDEMDRMLDMGFSIQINNILKSVTENRQTMLFSATVSKKIEKTTAKYLKNPVVVKIGEENHPSQNVSQEIINIENSGKFDALLQKLDDPEKFYLIFVAVKRNVERIAKKLISLGIKAEFLHGDIKQSKRSKVIQRFRDKKFNVLVASDVAARGLDINHIDVVINYDLPQSPEDYIHRIGRCSRGLDQKGTSISFCANCDKKRLEAIKSLIESGEYEEEIRPEGRKKRIERGGSRRKVSDRKRTPSRVKRKSNDAPCECDKSDKLYNIDKIFGNERKGRKRASVYRVSTDNR